MVLNYPIIHIYIYINGGLTGQIICGGLCIAMFDGVFFTNRHLKHGRGNFSQVLPTSIQKTCASRIWKIVPHLRVIITGDGLWHRGFPLFFWSNLISIWLNPIVEWLNLISCWLYNSHFSMVNSELCVVFCCWTPLLWCVSGLIWVSQPHFPGSWASPPPGPAVAARPGSSQKPQGRAGEATWQLVPQGLAG